MYRAPAAPARLRTLFLALGALPLLAFGLLMHQPAKAASVSTTFSVTATVATSCSVVASTLAFGAYDPGSPSPTTATSSIDVTCSLLTPYTISLDNGTYASGATRRLGSGASRLNYEVYRDPGMLGVFGLVTNALGISGVGLGVPVPTTVYGRIAAGQTVAPGSYTDQITVTVDY